MVAHCFDYQKPECDSEIVSWVESNFNFTAKTGDGKNIDGGIIMFEFLRRIVCVDDSAYSSGRWWDGDPAPPRPARPPVEEVEKAGILHTHGGNNIPYVP